MLRKRGGGDTAVLTEIIYGLVTILIIVFLVSFTVSIYEFFKPKPNQGTQRSLDFLVGAIKTDLKEDGQSRPVPFFIQQNKAVIAFNKDGSVYHNAGTWNRDQEIKRPPSLKCMNQACICICNNRMAGSNNDCQDKPICENLPGMGIDYIFVEQRFVGNEGKMIADHGLGRAMHPNAEYFVFLPDVSALRGAANLQSLMASREGDTLFINAAAEKIQICFKNLRVWFFGANNYEYYIRDGKPCFARDTKIEMSECEQHQAAVKP